MNELSNFELLDLIKHHKLNQYFDGVYSKDQLPTLKPTKFYIVNLEDSDGPGTHWTAFYYSPTNSIYFDSYGFIAPLEVEKKIKPYIFNDAEIQDYNSSACGFYCLCFIKFLHNKTNKEEAYKHFLKLFSDKTKQNDKILYELLY